MDSIVHAALEEICSQGVNGVSLSVLWPRLLPSLSSAGLHLCPAVKRAVWSGLVGVPGLCFRAQGSDFDPKCKSFEECEGLNLMVFADEQLRRCFVGLYDVKASNITPPQQRVLERLALAR
uniref:General transcription factor 3C polypeptide 1 winged-helix domain-containing protein n=1 Tax=Opuntia streptacantha TaxID=393608 RepID=A0A7C8YVM9_OPUST